MVATVMTDENRTRRQQSELYDANDSKQGSWRYMELVNYKVVHLKVHLPKFTLLSSREPNCISSFLYPQLQCLG